MNTARVIQSPSRTVMGVVKEESWTCIAADIDGEIDADAIGRRTITRHAYFAYRGEAESWLIDQAAEGFEKRYGPSACATSYFGPSDSPSNCWSVEVERAA